MTCAGPGCHTGTDLTAVHSRIGCDGCHSSTRAEVVAAIAGHKKDCSACHNPMAVHGAVHNSNPDYSGPVAIPVNGANGGVVASGAVNLKCAGCHRVNLLADHGTDYNNCPMCHASGGPRASFVTWDKTCRTGACHPIVNGNTAAPHPAPTRAMDHQLVANGQVPTGYCQSCHGNPEMWQCGAPFGCHASTTGPVTSVDYRPPTTTPTRTGTDPIVWKLNAADIGDGVTATYYSFDGAPFALYTAADMSAGITNPADVSAPYTHTLRYYSVDAANNIEATVTTSYNVTDITPPVVTFNGLWLGGTSYVAKSLVMSVTDPRVRGLNTGVAFIHTDVLTFYRIYTYPYPTPFYQSMADFSYPSDGSWDATRDITGLEAYAIAKNQPGSWPTWSGGNSTTNGGFEIQYYARDYAGNQTPMLHASLSIDNAAPVTTVSVVTAGATWKLPASDNAAGVASTYYSFDGAPLATYTPADASAGISNTTPGGTALGDHSLSYYSVDRLGNTEVTKTYAYTIAETTPPQGALSSTMTSSTVSIIAWDPVGPLGSSGIKSVTGGLYTGGGTLVRSINTAFAAGDVTTRTVDVGTIPADGQYCVSFTIYDWAGNVSPWVGPQYFKVDTTAPTTLVHWQWDGTWQVSGDDGPYGSGVAATYYSFDGAPFQLLVGPATTPPALLTQPGVHTLRCYSVDKLGHVEAAPKSDSFTVK